jgi:hypothetical protein
MDIDTFGPDIDLPVPGCQYGTTADECAMVRERSVAGQSDEIPSCPVHGPYPTEETA